MFSLLKHKNTFFRKCLPNKTLVWDRFGFRFYNGLDLENFGPKPDPSLLLIPIMVHGVKVGWLRAESTRPPAQLWFPDLLLLRCQLQWGGRVCSTSREHEGVEIAAGGGAVCRPFSFLNISRWLWIGRRRWMADAHQAKLLFSDTTPPSYPPLRYCSLYLLLSLSLSLHVYMHIWFGRVEWNLDILVDDYNARALFVSS